MRELTGCNAIVTGASRGIGVTIAKTLAAQGVNVALAARSRAELESVREEIVALGVRAAAIPTDVADPAQRGALVLRAEAELGPTDILVNNAGVEIFAPFDETDPADLERVVAVNLTAPMVLTRLVVAGMLERGRGHVVNIASIAGTFGTPFGESYSATKFGLIGFTHSLRAEFVDSPVGFSVVCPGFVADDGMYARMEELGNKAPWVMGATTPQKVADAVVRAIQHNSAELIVNGTPVRPLIALSKAFPQFTEQVMKLSGITEMFRKAAESRK